MTSTNDKPIVSDEVIREKLFYRSITSPLFLYPSVSVSLGSIAGALFGLNAILAGILVGGAAFAIGGFLKEFGFQREKNVKAIILEASLKMEKQREEIISMLKKEIDDTSLPNAKEQLREFEAKFNIFVDVLDDRFNVGELTFIRYMSVAEQVYLSAIDNLRNALIMSKSIQSTNAKELERKLTGLGDTTNDQIQRAAIEDRLKSYSSTLAKITELIVLNEKALGALDTVTAKLASTQVEKGMSDGDIESSVQELSRLGSMLSQYERT